MNGRDGLLERAEELAGSPPVLDLVLGTWRDPELATRFDERPAEVLQEFGIELPDGIDIVPLGTGGIGKPGPDFEPFEIRLSRCRTVVVLDKETGRRSLETVCFGIQIIPKRVPGGPIGRKP